MPKMHAPATGTAYNLIAFDAGGAERRDDPDGLMSEVVLGLLRDPANAVTDVFLLSHGWQGDVTAAQNQYDRWVASMAQSAADVRSMKALRPNFNALIVGVH